MMIVLFCGCFFVCLSVCLPVCVWPCWLASKYKCARKGLSKREMVVTFHFFHPANKSRANIYSFNARIVGKASTSRIWPEPVRIWTTRSTPIPHPAVGGKPYSSALQKAWSIGCASSSPFSLSVCCFVNLSRCCVGSFNSSYAFTISLPTTNSSKRPATVRP